MIEIRQYILSVIVGGIVCGIIHHITERITTSQFEIRLLANTVMLIILIAPITEIKIPDLAEYSSSFAVDAEQYISEGKAAADQATSKIIKEQTQAYILDKAESLNAAVSVEVLLDDKQLKPKIVTITESVSPYTKQQLEYFIKSELGISGENLQWK